MPDPCRTYYLQLLAPKPELTLPLAKGELVLVQPANAALNQTMYLAVGKDWGWTDKAQWPIERWQAYVAGFGESDTPTDQAIEQITTAVLRVNDEMVGYFELSNVEANVELRYFGLLSQAFGQGLGGALLSAAIERAWQIGAQRVWVHTCDLDHPAALVNYQRRGFELYQTTLE